MWNIYKYCRFSHSQIGGASVPSWKQRQQQPPANPQSTQFQSANPQSTQYQSANPQSTQYQSANPQSTQFQSANPQSSQFNSTNQQPTQQRSFNAGSSAPVKPAKPPHTVPSYVSGGSSAGGPLKINPVDVAGSAAMAIEATAEIQGW